MNAASRPPVEPPIARRRIYIALGLSLGLVVAVLVGSKLLYDDVTHQPVAVIDVDAPQADSATCSQVIAQAPDSVGTYDRVDLAEPAPQGAAAWVKDADNRIVLRCGMRLPAGLSQLNSREDHSGAQWVAIADQSGGDAVTWYSVGREQVLAITAPAADEDFMDNIDSIVAANPSADTNTLPPSPVQALAVSEQPIDSCAKLFDALPQKDDGLELTHGTDVVGKNPNIAVYTGERREPVAIACGVDAPPSYEPGVQIQQVDDVAWFYDENVADSPTGVWYGLGYDQRVAMIIPAASGNSAITTVSTAMSESLEKTGD